MIEMFRYLTGALEKEDRRDWILYAAFGLISPAVDIFSFSAMIYIIDQAVQENQASKGLTVFTVLMVVLSLLKCLFELYKSRTSNRLLYSGAQKLSMKVCELLIKEDLPEHNQKSVMQALNMVRNDTTCCVQIIAEVIGIAVNGITVAGYAALLIYTAKGAGAAGCAGMLALMAFVHIRTRRRMAVYGERSRACSIRANSQISLAYGSFKEMKIDHRWHHVLEKYRGASREYARVQAEYQYKVSGIGVILQNSVMAIVFGVLAVILTFETSLAAVLAPMMVYVTALVRMLPMAYGILRGMNNVEFARRPYETVKECMVRYEALRDADRCESQERQRSLTLQNGIFVRNLTFGYRGGERILENASVEIPAGCCVAVVGTSGVGKTTFVDLLLGLLRPESGHIFYDDYDIVEQRDAEGSCRADIGKLVSYIPQTVYLNGETVRNNVAFFEEESEIDEGKVEECLRCAQIWDDVMRMPGGIHTMIGENGTVISGGQRQRIALARALYKEFELLVMDEATAGLDTTTEMAVIDAIRQIKGNKTLIMVTHHVGLANECDVIYRIENKRLVRVR